MTVMLSQRIVVGGWRYGDSITHISRSSVGPANCAPANRARYSTSPADAITHGIWNDGRDSRNCVIDASRLMVDGDCCRRIYN
jgi:hypothetical protein